MRFCTRRTGGGRLARSSVYQKRAKRSLSKVSNDWKAPTTWDAVCRRAGGRRHYNRWRRHIRDLGRLEVLRLLDRYSVTARGNVGAIARELGGSPSTVCRDIKALVREHRDCPHCGQPPRLVAGGGDYPGLVDRVLVSFRKDVRNGKAEWAARGRLPRLRESAGAGPPPG